MAEEHDKTHRLLFGFPRMIEDLIRICLPGPWIEHLDFDSLEQVSERFIHGDHDMKRREADLMWRLRYGSEAEEPSWFYIYLNLEHMSSPRHRMAVDMAGYQVGAWQHMIRGDVEQLQGELLPPVLSVVFYNGDSEWRPKMLSELVQKVPDAPPGLELGTFVLVDAQRWQVTHVGAPLEALFKLEQVESIEDVKVATRQTREAVGTNPELEQAFVALLNNVVFRKLAESDEEPIHISNLEETSMLEQRIERIVQGLILQGRSEGLSQGLEQGLSQGLEQGLSQGLEQGEAVGLKKGEERLFLRLFGSKFGEVPQAVRERAAAADAATLERWAERLLSVDSADGLFED